MKSKIKGETCLFCNKNVSDQNSLILEENNGPKVNYNIKL